MIAKGRGSDRRRKQKRKVFSWLMVLCMVLTMFTPQFANAAAGDVPAHDKILTVNEDGTYTIALNVTGDAEKHTQKVNVIVIVDRSGSMGSSSGASETTYEPNNGTGNNRYGTWEENPDLHSDDDFFELTRYGYNNNYVYTYSSQGSTAYVPTNSTGTDTQYGLVNGQYVQLTRRGNQFNRYWTYGGNPGTTYNGVRYSLINNAAIYTGQRYTRDTENLSRLEATQEAVNSLATALLSKNGQDGHPADTVEMALVTFATTSATNITSTTSATDYTNAVNNITVATGNAAGTNWESALQRANTIDFDDDDPTFVIFFSDGSPTFRVTQAGYNDPFQTGVYGTGQEEEPNMERAYTQATDDAAALATKFGAERFYTIFAYGTTVGAGYMTNLTTAAGAPAGNNYSASNTAALQDAFDEILEKIEMAGIGNVDIEDGTTSSVVTSSGTAHLLDVDESSYKYYRAGGDYSDIADYDPDNKAYGVEWTDPPSEAEFVDGAVKWDLGDDILENGVTYTVTFDCWPSQDTLDHVASIKNDPAYYNTLPPEVRQYLDSNGDLKTNTSATLHYTDTRTGQTGSPTYDNPDPVETTAVEQLAVSKAWKNDLEDEWDKPASITLDVTRDGTNTYQAVLNDGNSWKDSVFISIGIMRTHGTGDNEEIELLTTGHNFTFDEPGAASGYKWELDVPVVRPMKINGTDTILVLVDEDHPAPDGAKTYTLPAKDGVAGGTYYVSDMETVGLTATNERRSSVNLTKVVSGEDVPEDATFPFTVNVVNSMAPATEPADDPNHDSDYWVWISVRDKDGGRINEGVTGATSAGNGWWYAPSGTDVTIPVKAGYSIRFNNLPVGSTYTITEGDLGQGFVFDNAVIGIIDGSGTKTDSFEVDKDTRTASGEVQETNTLYQVTMANKYELKDVTVDKIWDDASNQDGVRPTSLTLTLNGMPAGTTAPAPIIEKNGDTWTYTWKAIPRYDADGNEITYTVTENTVPADYTCTDTEALDGESITNSHTPELIDIPVTKVWEDEENQDQIRPESVTVELRANEQAVEGVDPITLSESNDWSGTFEDLPKKAGGQEISYTVVEQTTDVITGTDGLGTYAFEVTGSVANGFTVTNTHTPALTNYKVTKVWVDANNQDGYRPSSITVHLMNGNTVVDTQTLTAADKWTYEWKDLPKFDGKTEIDYSVTEEDIEHYTMTSNVETPTDDGVEAVITNTHETEKTTFTATKVWVDDNNRDGLRPDSVTVQLQDKDGKTYGDPVVLNAANDWTYTWEDLDVYPKVDEDPDAAETDSTGQDQDNSGTEGQPAQRSVPAAEGDAQTVESPAEDTEAVTPDEAVEETPVDEPEAVAEPDEEAIEGAEKREAPTRDGAQKIEYTVVEVEVPDGYEVSYEQVKDGDTVTGVKVTNTHIPETISIDVKKVWEDADNVDGIRPDEVTVNLKADGTLVGSKVLDEDNKWTETFENLPKYKEGETGTEIEYTLEEKTGSVITGTDGPGTYSFEVTGSVADGFTVTNTHTPEVIDIPVTKIWDDKDDMDGIRPDSVTVQLLADGTAVSGKTLELKGDDWTGTFEGLPKYKVGETGTEVEYTVEEVTDDVITGTDAAGTYAIVGVSGSVSEGYTVTNKHTPRTDVDITKVWDDADDVDGYRPTADQFKEYVELYANGVKVDAEAEVTVDPDDSNKFLVKFKDLPMFDEDGEAIVYTVKELVIEHYEAQAGEGVTVNDDGTADIAAGGEITNKHEPDETEVVVTKTWSDMDDKYMLRPTTDEFADSLHLMAGEEEAKDAEGNPYVPTVVVDEEDDNTYIATYSALPKNEKVDGTSTAIEYSVTEDEIPGYTASEPVVTKQEDGTFTVEITNTMEFGKLSVTKKLPVYENSNSNGATFVYSVVASFNDEVILDQIMTINLNEAGEATAFLPDLLPAGAEVTVTEIYSGAAYELASENDLEVTIVANETQNVDFTNEYDGEITQGYGILNMYENQSDKWGWIEKVKSSVDFGEPTAPAPADQETGE